MLEKDLEIKCCKIAKEQGYICVKLANYGLGSNFLPDRMFIGNNHIIFVEFKTKIGKVSMGQEAMFNKLEDKGYTVYIVRDISTFKSILSAVMKK